MLYVATGRVAYVILGSLLFALGSLVAYLLFGHVQLRVQTWLDPWQDPNGDGFQIVQSLFNIADGGIFGVGLGAGFSQTIPEVQTDFIFATIASELGLLGAVVVLLAFLIFVYRGIKISMLAGDDASKLLAFGLTSMFAIQTLVIVGGVTKTIPLTGITLPFVSYGGSSVVGNFLLDGAAAGDLGEGRSAHRGRRRLRGGLLNAHLRRTFYLFAVGFVALAVVLAYWQVYSQEELANNPANNLQTRKDISSPRGLSLGRRRRDGAGPERRARG